MAKVQLHVNGVSDMPATTQRAFRKVEQAINELNDTLAALPTGGGSGTVHVDGVSITGDGSVGSPLVAHGDGTETTVHADGVTITGDGSLADPLVAVSAAPFTGDWSLMKHFDVTQSADAYKLMVTFDPADMPTGEFEDGDIFTFNYFVDVTGTVPFGASNYLGISNSTTATGLLWGDIVTLNAGSSMPANVQSTFGHMRMYESSGLKATFQISSLRDNAGTTINSQVGMSYAPATIDGTQPISFFFAVDGSLRPWRAKGHFTITRGHAI